jgi:hypothetical protein
MIFNDVEGLPSCSTTGVVDVDHWHCDLIGAENTMKRLASLISHRVGEGQDRVRRFSKYQLQLMIERIIEYGGRAMAHAHG